MLTGKEVATAAAFEQSAANPDAADALVLLGLGAEVRELFIPEDESPEDLPVISNPNCFALALRVLVTLRSVSVNSVLRALNTCTVLALTHDWKNGSSCQNPGLGTMS